MNFIQNYFQKRTNNMIAQQDYELAEQLMNADLSFQHDKDENGDPDYPSITKKVYHLEAIFLDLTDRTQAHPKVPFATEDRGGVFQNIVKDMGMGNRKVIWKPSDLFNVENYMAENWFPAGLEMYTQEFNELTRAKELYCEREISFLEYFFKRLDTYDICEMPTFLKYYEGVDLEKNKKKIRRITANFPYINARNEEI